MLHPSQPVVAAREMLQPTRTTKWKARSHQLSQMIHMESPFHSLEAPSPPKPLPPAKALVLIRPHTPPCSFAGVMACLCTPELMELDQEVPVGTLSMGLVMAPGISSISSSCMVKDEATGLMYVDTITTSIGRIVISGGATLLDPDTFWPHYRGYYGQGIRSRLESATGQTGHCRNIPKICHWAD